MNWRLILRNIISSFELSFQLEGSDGSYIEKIKKQISAKSAEILIDDPQMLKFKCYTNKLIGGPTSNRILCSLKKLDDSKIEIIVSFFGLKFFILAWCISLSLLITTRAMASDEYSTLFWIPVLFVIATHSVFWSQAFSLKDKLYAFFKKP